MALRAGVLQDFIVDRLIENVGTAINENECDADTLSHARWFGSHLKAFLRRVVHERPQAARAILRFITTYSRDVYRRTRTQGAGVAAPTTVVIEPTDRCNLYCPGCYAKSCCDGSDLPYERMVEIVEQLVDMGVSLITISGGEPFLRERVDGTITRLAKRFRNQGFLVYTNGTLIDEATAA
jgi:sulfatase maturation enzyme AslB (radical SAM superfamily)